jgi:hypothetical protein
MGLEIFYEIGCETKSFSREALKTRIINDYISMWI